MLKRYALVAAVTAMCSSFTAFADEAVQILEPMVPAAHSVSIQAEVSGLASPARLKAIYGADADTLNYTNDFGLVTADETKTCVVRPLSAETGYAVKLLLVRDDTVVAASELQMFSTGVEPYPNLRYLKYLRSDGKQWINTTYKHNANTVVDFECEVMSDTSSWSALFGARSGIGSQSMIFFARGGAGKIGYDRSREKFIDGNFPFGVRAFIHAYGCTASWSTAAGDAGSITTTGTANSGAYPLWIYTMDYSGKSDSVSKMKLYGFWIGETNTSAKTYTAFRNFRPVLDNSGVPCLYDSVTRDFFRNAGTAAFPTDNPKCAHWEESQDEQGRFLGYDITFESSEVARTLWVCRGGEVFGMDTNLWPQVERVAEIPAGTTSHLLAMSSMPADWGDWSNCVQRFVLTGDGQDDWTEPSYWHDIGAPSVTLTAADASAGNVLAVTGNLDFFAAENCNLTVMTGTEPDAMTNSWPVGTMTEIGGFTHSMYEADTESIRYFHPGSTVYVKVVAESGGRTASSAILSVVMSAQGKFTTSPSVSGLDLTVSTTMTDVGANPPGQLSLWVGDEDDESKLQQVGDSVPVSASGTVKLSAHVPRLGDGYWQIRYENATADGLEHFLVKSAVTKFSIIDAATYTWKKEVKSGRWDDPANWTANLELSSGYPSASLSKAVFPSATTARVEVAGTYAIGQLNLSAKDLNITFVTNGTGTAGALKPSEMAAIGDSSGTRYGSRFLLDGVTLSFTTIGSSNTQLGHGSEIVLRHGASFGGGSQRHFYMKNTKGPYRGILDIGAGCTFNAYTDLNVNGGTESAVSEENSLIRCEGTISFNESWSLGSLVQLIGPSCVFSVNTSIHSIGKGRFDFLVPVDGWAAAPVRGGANAKALTQTKDGSSSALRVSVPIEAPIFDRQRPLDVPLIYWPTGIPTNKIIQVEFPRRKRSSYFYFTWGGNNATSGEGNPTRLWLHYGGKRGFAIFVR